MMHNNKKNEELQTRREFFKKAAKGALPILGAIVLANSPLLSSAETIGSCPRSCGITCQTQCVNTCGGLCTSCTGSCKNGCHKYGK